MAQAKCLTVRHGPLISPFPAQKTARALKHTINRRLRQDQGWVFSSQVRLESVLFPLDSPLRSFPCGAVSERVKESRMESPPRPHPGHVWSGERVADLPRWGHAGRDLKNSVLDGRCFRRIQSGPEKTCGALPQVMTRCCIRLGFLKIVCLPVDERLLSVYSSVPTAIGQPGRFIEGKGAAKSHKRYLGIRLTTVVVFDSRSRTLETLLTVCLAAAFVVGPSGMWREARIYNHTCL